MNPAAGWPVVAVLGCAALVACAAKPETSGRALYQSQCSGCHGATGAGDGEMSVFVRTGVPNLRELSLRNGGTFPKAHVVSVVTRVSAFHDDVVAMPDFGALLDAAPATYTAADGETIETNRAVLDIVAYLKGIQVRAPDPAAGG